MAFVINLLKRLSEMAKRKKMKGKSARHGRAPSPYQKHGKTPYRYSPGYYAWKRSKVASIDRSNKYGDQAQKELRV